MEIKICWRATKTDVSLCSLVTVPEQKVEAKNFSPAKRSHRSPLDNFAIMTAAVRARSPSPAEASSSKKARFESTESKGIQVPSAEQLQQYRQSYVDATPYRHAVIPGLLSDELVSAQAGSGLEVLRASLKESSRRAGHTVSEAKKAAFKGGDGSKRKRTFTR